MNCSVDFEAFGVGISVVSRSAGLADTIRETVRAALPAGLVFSADESAQFHFELIDLGDGEFSARNAEDWIIQRADLERTLTYLASHIRLTVAENAPRHVFVHSGAVSWKGRAILVPGASYSGKTTLTAELVKLGAGYYSDEYAVIDSEGFVQPFPKTLSMRGIIDDFRQVELTVEEVGGSVACENQPVGTVVISRFKKDAIWRPRKLSRAKGLMALIAETVPIRNSPNFTLTVLNRVAASATFIRSNRGEAAETAARLLEYLDTEAVS